MIEIAPETNVLIVGAGPSGTALANALAGSAPELCFLMIDAAKKGETPAGGKIFLTTEETAVKWNVGAPFNKVKASRGGLIQGITKYGLDADNVSVVDHVLMPSDGNPDAYGYVPLPGAVFDADHAGNVEYETEFQSVSTTEDGRQQVQTTRGLVTADVVIDATGYQNQVLKSIDTLPDNLVMAVYGGNVHIDNLPQHSLAFLLSECRIKGNEWGWIIPITEDSAEVVVATMLPRSQEFEWREQAPEVFAGTIKMFRHHNINISSTEDLHHTGFAVQRLPKKFYMIPGIIPFGESEGINNPLTGELIPILHNAATLLATQLKEAYEKKSFTQVGLRYYDAISREPYGNQLAARIFAEERRTRADGDESAVQLLAKLAVGAFPDRQELFEILRNGKVSPDQIARMALHSPREFAQILMKMARVIPRKHY